MLDLYGDKSMSTFKKELTKLINRYSLENGSNTPDFILAQFLQDCLNTFNTALQARDKWYGIDHSEVTIAKT